MTYRLFALAAVLALLISVTAANAAEPETEAANAAVDYIQTLQNPDGGFLAFDSESSAGTTIDAVFALAAAGRDPLSVTTEGNSPADYLSAQAAEYASDPGGAAKLALGVTTMGLDPADFGGVDLVAIMAAGLDADTGVYGLDVFDEAFYILALVAEGAPVPTAVVSHLISVQVDDGGWEFGQGFGSDTNTTAMALQALIAAGVAANDNTIEDALDYLHTTQNDDGGFGFLAGEDSDPNSTAFGIQALVAAGEDIDTGGRWAPDDNTPLDALLSFQNPETGAFQFFGEDRPFATYQAVPALMLAPFPDLETRRDSEQEVETDTPVETEEPVVTLTPTATAELALPPTGGGAGPAAAAAWPLAAAVAAGGLALGAAGVMARRRR